MIRKQHDLKPDDFLRSGVYALIDPRTNEVRYIGSSYCMRDRIKVYQHHAIATRSWSKLLKDWLNELYKAKLQPGCAILEFCRSRQQRFAREREWIKKAHEAGWPLLNTQCLKRTKLTTTTSTVGVRYDS